MYPPPFPDEIIEKGIPIFSELIDWNQNQGHLPVKQSIVF